MKSWCVRRMVVLALVLVTGLPLLAAHPESMAGQAGDFGQWPMLQLVGQYWLTQDLLDKAAAEPGNASLQQVYDEAADRFADQTRLLAQDVAQALAKNDTARLDGFRNTYRTLDVAARRALFPALQEARSGLGAETDGTRLMQSFNEYFPGYGYPEPGYRYRRGQELDREYKGVTWQEEEHTYSTSKTINLTVTLDVLGILKGLLGLGKIGSLIIGKPFEVPGGFGGHGPGATIVVNVSFTTAESIHTKTNRKYDVNKVWFELLRTTTGFGNSGWESCGKTYQIMMDPSGDLITTELDPIPSGS